MDDLLRKLRGLLVLGALWGVGWGVAGALVGLVIAVVTGLPVAFWMDPILEWGLGIGAYGLLSGIGFGKVLWWLESRRTLDEVSAPRVAGWSALGAALVPILFGLAGFFESGTTAVDVAEAMLLTAVLGAASAAGSLSLARGAAGGDAESRVLAGTDLPADERLLHDAPLPERPADARVREAARRPAPGGEPEAR